jgi:GT2 family glycosyltransferase
MDKKEIVFILLNYNQYKLTVGAIQNILSLEGDIGIIIVDNDSNDGSYKKLSNIFQHYNKVKICQSGGNIGYAKGNNIGIRKACEIFNPSFIAIMNPDVRINDKKIVLKLLDVFSRNNKIVLATGFMFDINKKLYFGSIAWRIPKGIDDVFLNISLLKRFYNPVAYNNLKISKEQLFYVEVVPGSFFVIRKNIFKKIGLFDESTFLMCEERILGWKLKKEGLFSVLVPNCFFFHNHPPRKQSLMNIIKSYNLLVRSRWYYNLNYNTVSIIIILPLFVISVFIGYVERVIIWMIKNIIKRH